MTHVVSGGATAVDRNVARVRFPPPPLNGFELVCDFFRKRRQLWRRLCVSVSRSMIQRSRELVEFDLVGVELRRVDA